MFKNNQVNFEGKTPLGQLLSSGLDVTLVANDDLAFGKVVARYLLFDLVKKRASFINSGNLKMYYDETTSLSLWMSQFEDELFSQQMNKMKKLFDSNNRKGRLKSINSMEYRQMADDILLNIFALSVRLGWSPIPQNKIAIIQNDKNFEEEVKDAMKIVEESEIEEQKSELANLFAQKQMAEVKPVTDDNSEEPKDNEEKEKDGE